MAPQRPSGNVDPPAEPVRAAPTTATFSAAAAGGAGFAAPRPSRRAILTRIAGTVLGGGLVAAGSIAPTSASHNGARLERDWRYCAKCRSLHKVGKKGKRGPCAAGGRHGIAGSLAYLAPLYFAGSDPFHEVGWRLCTKCRVIHLPTFGLGKCAARGRHAVSPTGTVYYLVIGNPPPHAIPRQGGWRQCTKCRALHSVFDGQFGRCPAGGLHDAGPTGADYEVNYDG